MYTGMFMPNGMIPPGIMQDGQRAQNAETFLTNQDTATMFMWRLMNLAISVFKWDNLPEGVDSRMLEFWLLRDGFVGFFYDEMLKSDEKRRAPEGYAVLPLLLQGEWDMYEYPKSRCAYAVNGFQYDCNEDNSVIIFNNYLRVPMWMTLWQYAYRLSEVQRTIDINCKQQRTARVIRCDEKERLTYLNAAKEVDEGRNWVHGNKNLDMDNFQVFDITTPFVANEMQVYKHQLWNEALTYLGIENVNTDKKERLISDEVINNMGDVEAERFTRLNARKQACDEINNLFGLDVDVDFRSGTYIRTGATGDVQVPVTNMDDGKAGVSYE
jgi:hypothetical protein